MNPVRYTIEGRAFPGFDTGDYVRFSAYEDRVATLTRERDEARAELAMAYTRALQAAAACLETWAQRATMLEAWDREPPDLRTLAGEILALTPDDIASITEEHEHG